MGVVALVSWGVDGEAPRRREGVVAEMERVEEWSGGEEREIG